VISDITIFCCLRTGSLRERHAKRESGSEASEIRERSEWKVNENYSEIIVR